MIVLTLEASTNAAKALLYDSARGIVAAKTVPFNRKLNEVATQDCEDVYRTVLEAGRQAASGAEVAAIALCGTWHSVVVCDETMSPLTRTYSWAYKDSVEETKRIRADRNFMLHLYRRTGCMIHSTYALYALMHLRKTGMELRDKRFATQSGYIFYKLTGERVESPSTMSGSGLLNVYTKEYDSVALSLPGLEARQFGRLETYRSFYPLLGQAASLLGLREGIPVVPSYPDGALNQVGASALGGGAMTISVGTSAAMRLTVDKPIIPEEPGTWCYVGVDSWVSGAAIPGAGSCVDWFRHKVLDGNLSFGNLENGVADSESSPVFLPFIFGERCPGWRDDRLGGFFDLDPSHTFASMYRGLLEGICFNLLQCYGILVSAAGEPEKIKLSGGIVNSSLWTQMLSDILDREVHVSRFDHASSLGAAALALHAGGELTRLSDFSVDSYTKISPRPGEDYREKYRRYLYWYSKAM